MFGVVYKASTIVCDPRLKFPSVLACKKMVIHSEHALKNIQKTEIMLNQNLKSKNVVYMY